MMRKVTEWPSTRWPIPKIMSSDGCKEYTVPLEMGPWYDFHEVGCHLGNVGLMHVTPWTRTRSLSKPITKCKPSPGRNPCFGKDRGE